MIPDKIFINPIPKPSDGYVGIAWTEAHGDEYKVYIRKDALLKWAKARKAELTSSESFVAGERKIIKEVIDKIESL